MYSNFQLLKKYISYYLNASNSKGHGIHSPFVFDFILNVLNNNAGYAPPVIPEEIRAALKGDKRLLDIVDYGAGSRSGAKKRKEVGQLARTALKSRKYAQLLFRIVKHYKPEYILELGTSLGVSTTYLALGSAYSKVITVEGSEAIAAIAKENF